MAQSFGVYGLWCLLMEWPGPLLLADGIAQSIGVCRWNGPIYWCLWRVVFVSGASYIRPCSRIDPNIDACALESARLAIPHVING
ncbi:unnamed protein product, partial [Timema podura]|nr:unnamed protein product [Timema podura]